MGIFRLYIRIYGGLVHLGKYGIFIIKLFSLVSQNYQSVATEVVVFFIISLYPSPNSQKERCETKVNPTRRYCEEPDAQKDLARTHIGSTGVSLSSLGVRRFAVFLVQNDSLRCVSLKLYANIISTEKSLDFIEFIIGIELIILDNF